MPEHIKEQHTLLQLTAALAQARHERGLTQAELGERAGLPQSHISKIELGKVDLRSSSLLELARLLELEVMLVPRQYVPVVHSILTGGEDAAQRPLYQPEGEDAERRHP